MLADLLGQELAAAGVPLRDPRRRANPRGACGAAAQRRWPSAWRRGELTPDFGPAALHDRGGAVLVAARAPLVAFNVELAAPATPARRTADRGAHPGGRRGRIGRSVRAIGLWLDQRGVAQVSTNVEDHRRTSLADVVAAVARARAGGRGRARRTRPATGLPWLPGGCAGARPADSRGRAGKSRVRAPSV